MKRIGISGSKDRCRVWVNGSTLMVGICLSVLLICVLLAPAVHGQGHDGHMAKSAMQQPAGEGTEKVNFPLMAAPGKKIPLGDGFSMVYGFDKKPKLGTVIVKLEIFDGKGRKDTSFEAKADAGMPSMKGAHETGDRAFVLNKKGDYLLPVNIVMPGDWEIRMTISREGKVVFRGGYRFDV